MYCQCSQYLYTKCYHIQSHDYCYTSISKLCKPFFMGEVLAAAAAAFTDTGTPDLAGVFTSDLACNQRDKIFFLTKF